MAWLADVFHSPPFSLFPALQPPKPFLCLVFTFPKALPSWGYLLFLSLLSSCFHWFSLSSLTFHKFKKPNVISTPTISSQHLAQYLSDLSSVTCSVIFNKLIILPWHGFSLMDSPLQIFTFEPQKCQNIKFVMGFKCLYFMNEHI